MGSLLYLLFYSGCIAHLVSAKTFLVTAPNVFHVGVNEKVSVQVGEGLLNKPVTCYLEQEVKRILMSKQETIHITQRKNIGMLELQILPEKISSLQWDKAEPPYLNLVCDVGEIKRMISRVLVSQHRGYIFIQTNQPIYNPTQKVQYRIFTLDHAMRPKSGMIEILLVNADGNIFKKSSVKSKFGIYERDFEIPDVAKPGVWKIKAYYKGDEKSPTVQEFKVQKFVLPSFGVTIIPEIHHLLVSAASIKFSIDVSYSYGKKITGGFHCRFGLKEKNTDGPDDIKFIQSLGKTGPVRNGHAEITLKITDIQEKLAPLKLEDMAQDEVRFYVGVSVTDTLSGELQESEILLPIVSQRYRVDLERTRSHYIPNMPFNIKVMVYTPTGLPAKAVPVEMSLSHTNEKSVTVNTTEEGAAFSVFNPNQSPQSISVKVIVDGVTTEKNVLISTSSSNDFLYISVHNTVLSPGDQLNVKFDLVSGRPKDGYIYYLVLSKGVLQKADSTEIGVTATVSLSINSDMIPSFRLIGYYYNTNGEIIADSIWVDVKDMCEGKVEITTKERKNYYSPKESVDIQIDVGNQANAKVALLAVDKAIYALNAQNKLTLKQVFASMQSYDLGCSYGGGENTAAVFNDAGLTFISHSQTIKSKMRTGFGCESGFRRQRRSIDLQKELAQKVTEFPDMEMQKCCRHGLILLPMKLSCEERKKRITIGNKCEEAFMKCCNFATQLREKKRQEELRSGHGRTASASTIQQFFDNEVPQIRQSFPPSFHFQVLQVKDQTKTQIHLPDSITTWEIQGVSLSPSHGFCVAKPLEIQAFEELFISLRLPYSVRKNEQMAIVVVIYNYGSKARELAVHMKQVADLCSPGSSSTDSYKNISLAKGSAETVTFSAVPLKDGEIPITIQLYDREFEIGVDAIQKSLLVMHEGVRVEQVESKLINLDGRSGKKHIMKIDGVFPNGTIPDSFGNIFVKVEDEVFGIAAATPLLSPDNVKNLIKAPHGCAEQTMIRMSPTALSILYLDSTNRWVELEPDMRDKSLSYIEQAYNRILTFKKPDGSYGAWTHYHTSNWLTALVVKVLSLVSECELATTENRQIVSQTEIRDSVKYLIKQQAEDGSFRDPNPVIHREMQGGIGGVEQDASLTAFIAIALNQSLPFLDRETDSVIDSISQATRYLVSRVDELQRPFALAITAYCFSTCLRDKTMAKSTWEKLKLLGKREGDCKVWRDDEDIRLLHEKKQYQVPSSVALTIETTAYALLTAIELGDFEEAKMAACFLSSQENYEGGFKSTQDTIMALEALSKYGMNSPPLPSNEVIVQFLNKERTVTENLDLTKKGEKVETDLKRILGNEITAEFSGKGQAKLKVVKAYYVPDTSTDCSQLAINVTVTGKLQYESVITENYNYDYNDDDPMDKREEEDFPRSAIEWFDAHTRRRRNAESNEDKAIIYEVCVSHSVERKLTGMAIADITLLSGFEPKTTDLDMLKDAEEPFISHYEIANGRVLLYFNKIFNSKECIAFEAEQRVPIGLLQPAPATFYDYYEPERRCTVFYAAPKRSKMVSTLCSNEVCQCAERACFKVKKEPELLTITKTNRFTHACFQPIADYGFIVTVMSVEDKKTFDFYHTRVIEVLKFNGDVTVDVDDIRVFAKRKHCKSQLENNQTYLIMGKDGSTTDLKGQMVYLLDSKTWVEKKLTKDQCSATRMLTYCKDFKEFLKNYHLLGCSQ